MEPIGRVVVQLPCTDGFELTVRWTDRSRAGAREATFDDSFLVETNDVALATAWLDHDARDWLLASRYVAAVAARSQTALLLRDGSVAPRGARRRDHRRARARAVRRADRRTC